MRIRTIKPEWLDDEKLAAASNGARLLSVALILMADDHGNGRAHPGLIAAKAWPYGDPAKTLGESAASLRELAEIGFIQLYEVKGQQYYAITNWARHQRIDNAGKPRVPGPLEADSASSPRVRRESAASSRLDPDPDPDQEKDPPKGTGSALVSEVTEVWNHFVTARAHHLSGRPPTLNETRRRHIRARIRETDVATCKRAIDGMFADPWHRTHSETLKPENVFRSVEKFEDKLAKADRHLPRQPPRPKAPPPPDVLPPDPDRLASLLTPTGTESP